MSFSVLSSLPLQSSICILALLIGFHPVSCLYPAMFSNSGMTPPVSLPTSSLDGVSSSTTTSAAAAATTSTSNEGVNLEFQPQVLPDRLLVAYTTNHCNDLDDMSKVTKAIEEGINVLIWSFISFEVTDANSQAQEELQQQIKIKVSQNIENYKMYRNQLADMGYDSVKHLIAFGGWNGPHLPPGSTGQELYQIFKDANLNFDSDNDNSSTTRRRLWDGIDWDLEGHDEIQNPRNEFTLEVLNQVGIFSQKAKEDGLIVSMAPPESYLDTTTNRFSRFVNLTYPDDMWHQEFQYHGHNVYAYVMAKYGQYIDFVFVQFYESYSHALYKTEYLGWTQSEFLVAYMRQLSQNGFGYTVNFEDDSSVDLKNQFVKVPLPKIVFGFANGWALNLDKAIFFSLFEISWAYKELRKYNIEPRGCGYWVVEEDSKNGVSLTKDLYDIIFGGDDSQSNSYNALTE